MNEFKFSKEGGCLSEIRKTCMDSPTACVGGIEAAAVNGRVRAELDPETVGLGLDDIGSRAVAAESGEYLAVLVSVSHLHAAHRRRVLQHAVPHCM